MFSGSKYCGLGANEAPGRMLDSLVHGKDRNVTSAGEPAVIKQTFAANAGLPRDRSEIDQTRSTKSGPGSCR